MSFPILSQKLLQADLLVFFDFEGTQFTHKAIAIGLLAVPKKPGTLELMGTPIPYHALILQDNPIGPVVEEMTGIHKELLDKEGKSFHDVVGDITQLTRPYSKKKYISYGFLDIQILTYSSNIKNIQERDFLTHVRKNYLDFHHYLEQRIVSEKGQSYSVAKLCEIYSIQEDRPHDPLSDSQDLFNIYNAYLKNEEKDIDLVLEHYLKNPYVRSINQKLASQVIQNGSASKEDLRKLIGDFL